MGHPSKYLADLTAGIIMSIPGRSFHLSFLCSFPPYSIQILFYPIPNNFCVIFSLLSFWLPILFFSLKQNGRSTKHEIISKSLCSTTFGLRHLAQFIRYFGSLLLLVSQWKRSLNSE